MIEQYLSYFMMLLKHYLQLTMMELVIQFQSKKTIYRITLDSSGQESFTAGTNEVFVAHSEEDVTVSIQTLGGSGLLVFKERYKPFKIWRLLFTRINQQSKTLGLIDLGSGFNGHKIKVLATVSRSVVSAKSKTNNTNETTTIDTQHYFKATTINLGKADVHKINSVFMSADFSTAATTSDTDITDRFDLDTGQEITFMIFQD